MKFSGSFHDFTSKSVQSIIQRYGVPKTVVEIGIFEGHTTFNMTNVLVPMEKDYKHYAIDPYGFSEDLPDELITNAEKLFKQNLEEFHYKEHIEFIHDTSWNGLMKLYQQGIQADFIYIDGDHRAPGVMEDLVLSYSILKPGGIILCDDSVVFHQDKLQNTPRLAVDAFVHCYWDKIEMLHLPLAAQTAFRKK